MGRGTKAFAAAAAVFGLAVAGSVLLAAQQPEVGPKVEKTYGAGLPRDRESIVFSDAQYPTWPLTPANQANANEWTNESDETPAGDGGGPQAYA